MNGPATAPTYFPAANIASLPRAPQPGRHGFTVAALTLFVLSVLLPCTAAQAAAPNPAPDSTEVPAPPYRPLDTLWQDISTSVLDVGTLFTRPLHFNAQDWVLTGSALGGTALLIQADGTLRREILATHGTDGDRVMAVGRTLGENLPGLLFAGAIYTTGIAFNLPEIRLMGRHVVQSLAYSAIATLLLKYTFGRHRPFLEDGPFTYEGPGYHQDKFLSFPSGHTTIAFAIASSLSADIENPWATAGLYSLATLTAVSRMYHDRHWGSDVFLAAAVASAIGYGTANLHERADAGSTSFYVVPTINGIAAVWVW